MTINSQVNLLIEAEIDKIVNIVKLLSDNVREGLIEKLKTLIIQESGYTQKRYLDIVIELSKPGLKK